MPGALFEYIDCELAPSAAFPEGAIVPRPVVPGSVGLGELTVTDVFCLVDTGSDYCIFPADFLSRLGIGEGKLETAPVNVLSGAWDSVFFTEVNITVPQIGTWTARVGFSAQHNDTNLGVLGQIGFFDRFKATFDQKRRLFEITPNHIEGVGFL